MYVIAIVSLYSAALRDLLNRHSRSNNTNQESGQNDLQKHTERVGKIQTDREADEFKRHPV